MRVSMVQENFVVGDIPGNYNKIVKHWDALENKSDLIIFSELCLTGYPAMDLLLDKAFLRLEEEYIKKLIEKSYTMKSCIIIGHTDTTEDGLYNMAGIIQDGYYNFVAKTHLPNYDVFDEKRYFKCSGLAFPDFNIITINNERLLILICEDMWSLNVDHVNEKIDKVIVINASPWDTTKVAKRQAIAKEIATKLECSLYYCNQVGGQDELVFDGSSFVVYPPDYLYMKLNSFETDFFITNNNTYKPVLALNHTEKIRKALVLGIKDYFEKNGFSKAVIGISGGVDSAVVADLAVDALGNENVFGIGMMTEYNSNLTKNLAKELCTRLNISYKEMNISKIIDAFNTDLESYAIFPKLKMSGVPYENLQSRIRGSILMSVSNQENALVLSTGNKSEISMGYCTLYGDMVGGFNPLKDVYKTEVFNLAKLSDNIPEEIITRPPTAELAEGQLDSDKLPDYPTLDGILSLYIESNYSRASGRNL